uniref:Occludin_ELL domain-containing protein n=1 Tax=Strongyloides papillosus TaxID=174720 RepID=A0A0N5CEM7_STREA
MSADYDEPMMEEINRQYSLIEKSKNDDLEVYNIISQMPPKNIEEFMKNYKKARNELKSTDNLNLDSMKEAVIKIENYYLKYKLRKNTQKRLDKWENISISRKNALFKKLMNNLEEQSWDVSKNKSIRTLQMLKSRSRKMSRDVKSSAETIEILNQKANKISCKIEKLRLKIKEYDVK